METPPDRARTSGLYDPRDAERFTGVPREQVRAWFGCSGERGEAPLFESVVIGPMGDELITFLQLVELDIAGMLVRNGAAADDVRRIRGYAAQRLGVANPLARIEMRTVASHVLQAEDGGDRGSAPALLGLIEDYAGRRWDYGDDWATMFYPLGRDSELNVDPRYRAGQLCVAGTGLIAIALAWGRASGASIVEVAEDYEVSCRAVEEAVAWFGDDLEQ